MRVCQSAPLLLLLGLTLTGCNLSSSTPTKPTPKDDVSPSEALSAQAVITVEGMS